MEIDEKILTLKQEIKAAQAFALPVGDFMDELTQSIDDGQITVLGYPMTFSDRMLLDGKISIRIPDDFIHLEQDIVKTLYCLGNPPSIVMSNEPFLFLLGLTYTEHTIAEEQLKEFIELARQLMNKIGPRVNILETKIAKNHQDRIATMALVSETMDEPLYNYMFNASIDNRLFIGSLTFNYKHHERLVPLAEEIINSLRITKKGQEKKA